MAALIYIISLFTFRGAAGFILVSIFLIFLIRLSKVPLSYMVKGLKAIVILMVITAAFNLFLTPGETVLMRFWIFTVTLEGVKNAAFMLVRLIYLIVGTSIMTLTTTPNQLTDGLEKALAPLSRIKVPVHAVAMMMSIALRFIPILIEETDIIMKAQMARGADFENGSLIRRAKSMVPLLVPLLVRRPALVMEARCYVGGSGRTKMKPLRYGRRDYAAYLILAAYLAGVILLRIFV